MYIAFIGEVEEDGIELLNPGDLSYEQERTLAYLQEGVDYYNVEDIDELYELQEKEWG